MQVFERLKTVRAFEKKHLGFIRTAEDHDLVCEIGWRQSRGTPLTVKEIFLLGLGSVATVQRRLARLRALGVIEQTRCEHDRRSVQVTISPKTMKLFARYSELMASAGAEGGA